MSPKDVFEETTTYAFGRHLKSRDIDLGSIIERSELKIVAVTGARRSGKSSVLMLLAQKLKKDGQRVSYINAEDTRLRSETLLEEAIKWFGDEGYLIIDEITSATNWAGWLARMHEMLKGRLRIIVSSSRSGFSAPPKALRGRIMTVEVFPLSFKEFLEFNEFKIEPTTAGQGRLEEMFNEYLRFGGFPEVVLIGEEFEKVTILNDYFKEILGLDVGELSRADVALVKLFGRYALDSPYFSASKCLNYMKSVGYKIGKERILQLEHYSQESYLFFFIPVFGRSVKDAAQYPRKAYPADTGFFYAVTGADDRGRVLESMVFLELRRRLKPGDEIFYWRSRSGREVDFVIRHGTNVVEAIQVCCDLHDPKTMAREIDSLNECLSELKMKKGLVIAMDRTGSRSQDRGFVTVSALDWVLGEGPP